MAAINCSAERLSLSARLNSHGFHSKDANACSTLPFELTLRSIKRCVQSSFFQPGFRSSALSSFPPRAPEPRAYPKERGHPFRVRAGIEHVVKPLIDSFSLFPSTWASSLAVTSTIFVLGSPVLLSGLTVSGMAAAFVLGLLTWKAFASRGFLIVALYFILGTAVTKVRMKQKEAEGIAEKKKGRRGPGSVWGSGTAGILCALAVIMGLAPSPELFNLFQLGFVASFCTKLSDTSSSEIGKAFGRTTYLITTFEQVARGTEGAVSVEGTLAGLVGSSLLASIAVFNSQIHPFDAAICVFSSQLANYAESYLGATLQDKEGYEWLTNDVVNVLNISLGATLAIVLKLLVSMF